MMHLRVVCESRDSEAVTNLLLDEVGVVHMVVSSGVSEQPAGDVIEAEVAREVAEDVLHRIIATGVTRRGEASLQTLPFMMSDTADAAKGALPGDSADAMIWDELVATTGEESRLTPSYLSFLTIACLLAAVGIIQNSPIIIVGAMVVSPDFGPLAALAVAALGKRRALAKRAGIALGVGFPVAMAATALFAFLAELADLFDPSTLIELDLVSFIYQVGPFSVIIALLAGTAGMLALTSEKSGALIGVFISVTTVPAAGFTAVAAVAGDWTQSGEALLQLLVNLAGITIAGIATLWVRRRHFGPAAARQRHASAGALR